MKGDLVKINTDFGEFEATKFGARYANKIVFAIGKTVGGFVGEVLSKALMMDFGDADPKDALAEIAGDEKTVGEFVAEIVKAIFAADPDQAWEIFEMLAHGLTKDSEQVDLDDLDPKQLYTLVFKLFKLHLAPFF